MKRCLICIGTIVAILTIWVISGERQILKLKRTVVARVSSRFGHWTTLLPTDLNNDGKMEVAALHNTTPVLILHPFDNPQTLQLPPPIGDLSDLELYRPMKQFPTHQRTWLRLRGVKFIHEPFPPQVRGMCENAKVSDVDGDGVDDLVVSTEDDGQTKHWWFALNEKGEWQLKGELHSTLSDANFWWRDDLDGDGKVEGVKVKRMNGRWRVEIWGYNATLKQWRCIAASPNFTVTTTKGQGSQLSNLWLHDLDADGRKEIVGIWQVGVEPFGFVCGSFGCRPIYRKWFPAATVVFQWCDNRLVMHRHRSDFVALTGAQSYLFEHNGKRYLLLPKHIWLRFPLPRLASFNPPTVEWLEKERTCSELLLLPRGRDAFKPSKWEKVAELPGEPLAVGDWDKDGQIELLLRRGYWTNESPKAIFARLSDRGAQWMAWQIKPQKPAIPLCALPLAEGNRYALFVGWNDGTIERVEW